jgi:hypothetical protein
MWWSFVTLGKSKSQRCVLSFPDSRLPLHHFKPELTSDRLFQTYESDKYITWARFSTNYGKETRIRKSNYKCHRSFAGKGWIYSENLGRWPRKPHLCVVSPQSAKIHKVGNQGTGCRLSHDSAGGATKETAFWPYKLQLLQKIKPGDQPLGKNFCNNKLNHLDEDNLFSDKISPETSPPFPYRVKQTATI